MRLYELDNRYKFIRLVHGPYKILVKYDKKNNNLFLRFICYKKYYTKF